MGGVSCVRRDPALVRILQHARLDQMGHGQVGSTCGGSGKLIRVYPKSPGNSIVYTFGGPISTEYVV